MMTDEWKFIYACVTLVHVFLPDSLVYSVSLSPSFFFFYCLISCKLDNVDLISFTVGLYVCACVQQQNSEHHSTMACILTK